jgi:hypothetical protein
MIEVDLRAGAYELVREGVAVKGRKSGVYTVLMPKTWLPSWTQRECLART